VTQESYNRSTRKRKSSRRKRDISRSRRPSMEPVEERVPEEDTAKEHGAAEDVFSFLVDEKAVANDKSSGTTDTPAEALDAEQEGEQVQEPDPVPYPDDAADATYFSTGSFHSDSGISLDDGSFTIGNAFMRPLLSKVEGESGGTTRGRTMWHYPEVPRPQHVPHEQTYEIPLDYPQASVSDHQGRPFPTQMETPRSVFSNGGPSVPLSTDHLASKLANRTSPPLFKAFRRTNYRILLQLQDEISELQEELAEIDVYDGSRRPNKDSSTSESLRRLSFQWGQYPYDLYRAKKEVLGRLQIRMDQYCLSSRQR
jgi:hypothetical protein